MIVLNDYGCLLAEMGDLNEAQNILERALEAYPLSVTLTYQNLANVYELQKNFQKAIEIYQHLDQEKFAEKIETLYNKIKDYRYFVLMRFEMQNFNPIL